MKWSPAMRFLVSVEEKIIRKSSGWWMCTEKSPSSRPKEL
jgi:hypothetical protein